MVSKIANYLICMLEQNKILILIKKVDIKGNRC